VNEPEGFAGWRKSIKERLQQRSAASQLRMVTSSKPLSSVMLLRDGKEVLHFASNDYLGLGTQSEENRLIDRESLDSDSHFQGAGAAPLICGYTPQHASLERELASFEHTSSAVIFTSGYSANLGVVSCLAGQGDLLLSDSLNHASLIDGCRLSKAEKFVYAHQDFDQVRSFLKARRLDFANAFLVTDSLFSMHGNLLDVEECVRIAQEFSVVPIIDEAHATGVYGPAGRGWIAENRADQFFPVKLGTLSKAIGALGGFFSGDEQLSHYVRNFARSYVYSTSMPARLAQLASRNLSQLQRMDAQRKALRENSSSLRREIRELGLDVPFGDSPIIPIIIGQEAEAMQLSSKLLSKDIYVPCIRPPTVPKDQSMLRVSLNSNHSQEHFSLLLDALRSSC
jgi:8-amino-7-oxononanoate synthase